MQWLIDADNLGDGRDLKARVRLPADETGILEYRALVVRVGAANLGVEAALAAPGTAYQVIATGGGDLEVTFGQSSTNAEGEAVTEGPGYRVRVLSVAQSTDFQSALSSPSEPVTLAKTDLVQTVTTLQAGTGGMDVDAAGNVYAADFGGSLANAGGTQVWKITPQGQASVFATGLQGASGNAFDSQGNLFQSNISGNSISKIDPNGMVTTFVTQGINGPVGIAIDPGDTLYVANCGDNTIQKVTPGAVSTQFASSPLLNCPNGIALASDGNFYVSNFSDGFVLQITPAGAVSVFASVPGSNNGHILFGNGLLYVVARSANQIYELSLQGQLTVLAGTGTRGLRDGAALTAELSLTNDVALSPDGTTLYFNDVATISNNTTTLSPVSIRRLVLVGG